MFSRLMPLAVSRTYHNRAALQEGRRMRPVSLHHHDRIRAWFRPEALEVRCLLSGISSITEFPVAGAAWPYGITAGPNGNLWFTELNANMIGEINPTTHAISQFVPPKGSYDIQGITSAPDGNVWFAEWGANKIGMINPTTDAITQFTLPSLGTNVDPHMITAGPDGNIWFTDGGGGVGYIGMINPSSHAISEFAVPYANSLPFGITTGPDGNLWFADEGNSTIGTINPTTRAITEFAVPTASSTPFDITAGSDGNLWFTESGAEQMGEINPTTDAISEFSVPTAGGEPYGITAGPDGNLWFGTTGADIGMINPMTDAVIEYPAPYKGTGVLHSTPEMITAGPDGNLWFAEAGNAIGVATLTSSQLAVTQQPAASVAAGSGFGLTVEAEDSSGNLLSSFNGTVTVALANNPGDATLGGTLTATAYNGVATFSNLSLTAAAVGYTLDVSASGLGSGITSTITVTPAAATQVVVTTEPSASVTAGSGFGLQASIEDSYGNVVTSASNTLSVALANNPTGATLGGTLAAAAVDGVATFSGLSLTAAAPGYTLAVSSGGLFSATSSAITVTPAAATQVVITGQPPASVGLNASFGLSAAIEDAYGNVETSSNSTVKVALDNNPGGAKLGGTLSVKASKGVATFSGLTLNKVGTGYTLELTSSGLTSVVTSPINVTKTSPNVALSPPAAAPDVLLAPLVLDTVELPGSLGLKKRLRSA
jgi:streptogramin lyase